MLQVLHMDVLKVDRVFHILLWLYTHVLNACFICFKRMLQVFHFDVSKVDLEEAHVAAASAPPWVTVSQWVTAHACWWWWWCCCCCVYANA
jgi:hypothetical protein